MLTQVNVLAPPFPMRAVALYASLRRILAMRVPVGTLYFPFWEVAAVCLQPHLGLEVGLMKLGVSYHYVVMISLIFDC